MGFDVGKLLHKPITLKRSEPSPMQVRTRLTPSGWGFFGLIFCSFLLAVNFSNNLIFAMAFLLVSIALVGWLHTRVNISGLDLSDWKCGPVFAGQDAVYRLTVENRKKEDRIGLRTASSEGAGAKEIHLAENERTEMVLKRKAPSRGRLRAIPADIRSCFPMGIFQVRMGTRPMPDCLVYPEPAGDQPIPDRSSSRQAHLASESGTYRDTRRYAPGDPLSRIDWKAMARFDELYTKEFDGARGRPALWLRWEDVRAAGTERKLSQLCRWILDAHKQNREYGLEIPGAVIEPSSGEVHRFACLTALALYGEPENKS
jgi:uncharacterized protein (DUF58 family)